MVKSVPFKKNRAKLMASSQVRQPCDEMALEFAIATAVIQVRIAAKLTKEEQTRRAVNLCVDSGRHVA